MELRHLKYFVVVAEERHFTRAAERLGMAQPPLSQQIRKLEHEIGALLFRRLTRGVELTDAGRVLYEDARRIVDQVEQAKTRAQSAARGQTGHIRVGFASSVVFHPVIAEIVRAYRETHPDVRLSPSESNVAALIDDLLAERIDLAIIRQTAQESERLKIEALFDEHMVVALPPQHRLGGEADISLQSLAQETLIMFPRSIAPVLYDEVMSACQRAGFSPQLGQESTQVASAVSMVAAGFGVSIVPESIRQVAATGVTYHAIDGPGPKAQIVIAYRSTEFSKVVRDFLEVARRSTRNRHYDIA
ncbi:DNA-binding transcriptional regulator, LysR family [Burkholderia sp. YR290]|jgi:DNA-binding transcriptional LysR family regulator|uniref:LysR family transcriptional regulator n=1 Tax=Paraburkholderia hospita TaxID=169430 RepID=UPI0009A79374|nr:LysR family transcriptional regulator [Paraburkholderia hospita]SKC88379.1 DNA-binding transcriptional regulator, LysR family [Paraburkholderia hospita]SOE90579.1 DNA-binding transcriptional regulator, LysR family [Burkholderia sp. YR290]